MNALNDSGLNGTYVHDYSGDGWGKNAYADHRVEGDREYYQGGNWNNFQNSDRSPIKKALELQELERDREIQKRAEQYREAQEYPTSQKQSVQNEF